MPYIDFIRQELKAIQKMSDNSPTGDWFVDVGKNGAECGSKKKASEGDANGVCLLVDG
jgi:hypothetical protein